MGKVVKTFKQYLGEGKIITAYHGSRVPIKRFTKKGIKDLSMQGVLWFSEDRDKIVRGDAGIGTPKYLMTVKLTVDNPAGWDEYEKLGLGQIESRGFDSILLDDDWVMFDPKNIKVTNIEEVN